MALSKSPRSLECSERYEVKEIQRRVEYSKKYNGNKLLNRETTFMDLSQMIPIECKEIEKKCGYSHYVLDQRSAMFSI